MRGHPWGGRLIQSCTGNPRWSSFQDTRASSHASDPFPQPRYSHQPVDIFSIRLQQVSICTQTDPTNCRAPLPFPPGPAPAPQTPTQVGEQQCPHGALVCLIGHLWGLRSLVERQQGRCHPQVNRPSGGQGSEGALEKGEPTLIQMRLMVL